MDPGSHLSIVILDMSNQAILIVFDQKLCRSITLLVMDIESLIVPHLKDLIRIYLELQDQDPSRNLKMTYALSNNPYFTS